VVSPSDSMDHLMAPFREAVEVVRARTALVPDVALVVGTGLDEIVEAIEVEAVIPLDVIPHIAVSPVHSPASRLVLGRIEDVPVVGVQGHLHHYEGYTLPQVIFPLRVMRLLGAGTLVLAGACGGLEPTHSPGDLVVLDDVINLMGDSPLVGPNLDELGPRFPDMSEPFDRELQALAVRTALEGGVELQRAVHAAIPGPNLGTRAEYRMLRTLGAHVVGTSTAPEVIVARHMQVRVLGLSVVANQCFPDTLESVEPAFLSEVAGEAAPRLSKLIRDVVRTL